MVLVVQHELATTEDELATLKHELTTTKRELATTLHELTVTMYEAASFRHQGILSATTDLHDLATDCLWLSVRFFHPIRLSTQQVYHSALPLSPTSSLLRKVHIQSVVDDRLSRVITFSGAPDTWGLLLRTIDVRPRQLTCTTTSVGRIIAACGGIVKTYDAVTGVLQQFLHVPEAVTKIQGSPDGSILFFAHSSSVTMWDVQTGGLVHTFTTRSAISDIAVSTTGDHVACGLSDGSVALWNIRTKVEGRGFGDGQPVLTIHWLSPLELAVATQSSVYILDVAVDRISNSFPIPGPVWGMVYSTDGHEFMVGTSRPGEGVGQELCTFEIIKYGIRYAWGKVPETHLERQLPTHPGRLIHPTLVGKEIVCITQPSGVQSFDTDSRSWTNNPPLLRAATSVAVSLNRHLVAQTKNSIQIFSLDVLKAGETRNNVHPPHIYPLGQKHVICVHQPDRHLTLLELETLQELRPNENTPLLRPSLTNQSSSGHGLIAEFGVSVVVQAWQTGTPLPEWTEAAEEDAPLVGLLPEYARVVAVYGTPRQELRVKDVETGITLANLSLEDADFAVGEVYGVTFDSETRFCIEIDRPGWHVQIPHDIIASPSGPYSHTITQGEPVPLSEPRVTPPYTLDANREWVSDGESRKICWIPPENLRRGNGGHFWAGLSLVMVGDDGVVRKLTFEEPNR